MECQNWPSHKINDPPQNFNGIFSFLGYELAGEVLQIGKKVTEFSVGDRVLGIKTWGQGAFAEQCLVNVNVS